MQIFKKDIKGGKIKLRNQDWKKIQSKNRRDKLSNNFPMDINNKKKRGNSS